MLNELHEVLCCGVSDDACVLIQILKILARQVILEAY